MATLKPYSMYSKHVNRKHVLSALHIIDKKGVPTGRKGRQYGLEYKKRTYPPKYTLTLANKLATGVTLKPGQLNGGKAVNDFLHSLGFHIISQSQGPRILRLVLKTEYDLFNKDRQLSKSFTGLGQTIKDDQPYDFLLTPGGFLHFSWPNSFKNIDVRDDGAKRLLPVFKKFANEAFLMFWSGLTISTRQILRKKVKLISVGIDSNDYDENDRVTKCVQLVGLFDIKTATMLHWTGKSYASITDIRRGLIPFDDLSSHFKKVKKQNICLLGCHDLKLVSPRAKAVAGRERQVQIRAFDLEMKKKKPTVILQHPHNTDTPLIWNTEWKTIEKKYPSVRSYASGIRYYNYGYRRRKSLSDVLEKTCLGDVTDVIC
jgi:hypothetical protein